MGKFDPATWLLIISSLGSAAALLDAIIWYFLWRGERRWEHIGADSRAYCVRQIKQGLCIAIVMGGVALYAIYSGGRLS